LQQFKEKKRLLEELAVNDCYDFPGIDEIKKKEAAPMK